MSDPSRDPTPPGLLTDLDTLLGPADAAVAARRTVPTGRHPLHTCYVPADRYDTGTVAAWGAAARHVLAQHADHPDLTDALGLDADQLAAVLPRVTAKLATEPVEDLRIDFEDGYGLRTDAEEDAAAAGTAAALAAAPDRPPWAGLRIRSLEPATRARAVRTLAAFLTALLDAGADPAGLIVTLPKVSHPDQVRALVLACAQLEDRHGLAAGSLRCELQIELPEAVLAADGTAVAGRLIDAAEGRCDGLHYGTYDYSAALGIEPAEQRADHPAAEFAKALLAVLAAPRGVRVVDGSSNVLPVGDAEAVLAAWRIQARVIRRALVRGIAQGWDLHPAQLPCRYLVTFAHLRAGAPAARARLAAYRAGAASGVLDEPATERALVAYLDRARSVGAIDPADTDVP